MSESEEAGGDTGWDASRAQRWLAQLDQREASLAPVSDAIFAAAALRPGERVLDVGCGAGSTTMRAAEAVGPGGHVLGVDISPEMLDAARNRFSAPNLDWLQADIANHEFDRGSFDVVISRFGVMFFEDPLLAFQHLHRAGQPGSRLVIAVWPRRDLVPYFDLPYRTVAAALDERSIAHRALHPLEGMFSMGDERSAAELLLAAEWTDVTWTIQENLGYVGGPGPVEAAVPTLLGSGPVHALLDGVPAVIVEEISDDLAEALQPYDDGTGVRLPSNFVIMTASR